jgi:hypothetical protein
LGDFCAEKLSSSISPLANLRTSYLVGKGKVFFLVINDGLKEANSHNSIRHLSIHDARRKMPRKKASKFLKLHQHY